MKKTINTELLDFISASPSQFHAAKNIITKLSEIGFTEITSQTKALEKNHNYFFVKNQSSVIAFRLPDETPAGLVIAACHSDSPTFQIKDNPEIDVGKKYIKLNASPYGGMLCSTWLDRPLSIAGRIMALKDNGIESILVNIDRDLLLIPNLAIHMNRTANTGFEYKANVDMLPLFGEYSAKDKFIKLIAKNAKISEKDILATELFLYNRAIGSIWGADNEFISAPRLDDLQCAFSAFSAFINTEAKSTVPMYMLCDNEEIGSDTKQGAGSTILSDIVSMIYSAYELSAAEKVSLIENSFMLSCDNAHAMHPNHSEVADPSNKPVLNGGVVVKYGVRYATDSIAEAIFRKICNENGIKLQTYSNRSDMAGGSTLGNISNTQLSLNTVDIGLAQLAMHSSFETAGAKDTQEMINAVSAVYSSKIVHNGSACYTIAKA